MTRLEYLAWFECKGCGQSIKIAQTTEELPLEELARFRFSVKCDNCNKANQFIWPEARHKHILPVNS